MVISECLINFTGKLFARKAAGLPIRVVVAAINDGIELGPILSPDDVEIDFSAAALLGSRFPPDNHATVNDMPVRCHAAALINLQQLFPDGR